MRVELLDPQMVNSDLGAVNAARVSFAKEHKEFEEADEGLLKYLVKHDHWSPLAHPHVHVLLDLSYGEIKQLAVNPHPGLRLGVPFEKKPSTFLVTGSAYAIASNVELFDPANKTILKLALLKQCPKLAAALSIGLFEGRASLPVRSLTNEEVANTAGVEHLATRTFRITAPIFVARQLVKHQVDLVWNEVSRRYVDEKPTFWRPRFWRARVANVKQGSKQEAMNGGWLFNMMLGFYEAVSLGFYNFLLARGVAPELARIVLPLTLETEWWWTGRVEAFDRVLRLRLDEHAQADTREVALLMQEALNVRD